MNFHIGSFILGFIVSIWVMNTTILRNIFIYITYIVMVTCVFVLPVLWLTHTFPFSWVYCVIYPHIVMVSFTDTFKGGRNINENVMVDSF